MGANPHANGGLLLRDLALPDFRSYAVPCRRPGGHMSEPTRVLGGMLRDVMKLNGEQRNFRIFGPDETESNRLGAVLEVTGKTWEDETIPTSMSTSPRTAGSWRSCREHTCQGWLEGYLLTGRHGLFSCYEAFIHIVDSMFNQHAKWLKVPPQLPWRRPVASLNILLTSHVWRQDHNGFSHQDPGFIDHVMNKKAEVIRVYLPPDANTLLSVADHCLRSRDYVNVVVAGKQPTLHWLDMEAAACIARAEPASGSGPAATATASSRTSSWPAPATCPRSRCWPPPTCSAANCPDLKVRVVNVVDLMRLQPEVSIRTA